MIFLLKEYLYIINSPNMQKQFLTNTNSYNATVSMNGSEFRKTIADLKVLGESINMEVSKHAIEFSTDGDIGKASVTIKQNSAVDAKDKACEITVKEKVSLAFGINYLSNFTKATPLSPRVCISMSDGVPMVVEYSMEDIGHIRYYLAPKIE